MIISRTPFRVSFFGGGTDYPVWFYEHGGAVLSTTIDKYCYISARYLPPFFEHRHRIVYSKIENVQTRAEIEHPAVREALKFMGIEAGIEVHHDADLPARTGLGSSSSFTVGLLHSLHALQQRMPTKMQLAQEAIVVERDLIKENVGSQDQVAAAFGGFNRISFKPNGEIATQPVILKHERLERLQRHLMLYFTGFSRHASQIAEKQIQNAPNKKIELSAMAQLVEEALSILTGEGALEGFGTLLDEAWKLKRSLADNISTSQIDAIYEAGREAGALGGKLLGAGGGGFILFFVRPEDQPKVQARLRHLLQVPFRFETAGSQIIFYDHAALSRPALEPAGLPHPREESLAWA